MDKAARTVVVFLVLVMVLAGCRTTGTLGGRGSSGQDRSGHCLLNTIVDMRASAPHADGVVILKGYHAPGDGGGGVFIWDAACTRDADGGIVVRAGAKTTGRYLRMCEPNRRNVAWFGATGNGSTDDTRAIQAAIDSLPARGGTVSIPAGTYLISDTIQVGDGDAGHRFSTRNAVKLVGEGGGFGVSGGLVPTVLTAETPLDCMISVNGRISDCAVERMFVHANGKAATGIRIAAASACTFANLKIQGYTEKGLVILGGTAPTGNYNIFNRFEFVNVVSTLDNTTCLFMDGDYESVNDTWLSTFTGCRFDTHTTKNSTCAHFRFVDSVSFFRCHFATYDESSEGIVFDALDNHDYPCGMAFHDCSISKTKVLEDKDRRIRVNTFYGAGTYDNEAIPQHEMLIGVTDMGVPFHMDAFCTGGTCVDDGCPLPGKSAAFESFTNAAFSPMNLAATGSQIGIRFRAEGSFRGGSIYCPSFDNDIGTVRIRVFGWQTDYATSVAGPELCSVSWENFRNNSWLEFGRGMDFGPGEFLVAIDAETTPDDYGAGVWTKAAAGAVRTYIDGKVADVGVIARINVE